MTNRWKTLTALVAAFIVNAQLAAGVQEFQGPELEQFLARARIADMEKIGTGVTNPEKATLELNGITRYGVWKVIDEQKSGVTSMSRGFEIEFQDSWRTEIAAYELDKLLGLGMVPATVERTFNGRKGSIQYWVDLVMPEAERIKRQIRPTDTRDWGEQMFKARLFDNLIYNTDRHLNNMLITEDFKLRLIDHSRTFRTFDVLNEPDALQRFSKSLLARLRELDEPVLKERLGEYLSSIQIRAILKRRDAILKIAEERVKQKGEAVALYP
jgi:hypothetical protein